MDREKTFQQVLNQIGLIKEISLKRGWELTQDLLLEAPASEDEILWVEKELGIDIPDDCKDLFRLSKHLEFRYEFFEAMPADFRNNFSGEICWNLNQLKEQQDNFREWVEVLSLVPANNNPESAKDIQKRWINMIPLIEIANGDFILICTSTRHVIYFSCQENAMHGRKIGNNLWEFLEFYSRIGFAGGESWQLEPFFGNEEKNVHVKEELVDKFEEWLQSANLQSIGRPAQH
ncbi:SMI1/KNR4 family protein [Pontibacter sp. 13R65]|uniref:SMI1/KNR4 family protein n=1 Tax=Pontibacter sp. 13R65 TaxID=3127458 RepID=UPI00301C8F4A